MEKVEYTVSTSIVGTDDGRSTYEIRKTFSIETGRRAVVLALYPTVSIIAPYTMDNSTLYLLNKAYELGYKDLRVINIYSKVCKGKPSCKQLSCDDENIDYIRKVFEEEKNEDTDIIISWGSSLKLNETTKNVKIQVLKMLKTIIPEKRIKQFSANDLDTESLLTPHVLWMGLHCKDAWYTEVVSVDMLLASLGVVVHKEEVKQEKEPKKTRKKEKKSD